ncbi:MAG: phosphoglycerate dehydrogenase [Firmicutes bacterium]|nr:phosphoglycerate dehydrogenase [Bacillota bacterium]
MFKIATLNKISPVGLAKLTDKYQLIDNTDDACGIVVRSQDMKEMDFSDELLAIARAGVGVNNIPTSKCADEGIVVFNTPGANANAVKELVIGGMLLASRNIVEASNWAHSLEDDIAKQVEKGKSQFKGNEIIGKTIGVIGLGGIGVPVANTALKLGMKVMGYDAYLSVNNALHLSDQVYVVNRLEDMLPACDFITMHVHATEETNGMINADVFSKMKDGAVLMNFARASIVDTAALKDALASGKLSKYVTDFPNADMKGLANVIMTPHLGASTDEAEDNCANMAVTEMMDYLENGNIKNSVNFPAVDMGVCRVASRIGILHKNIPNMIGKITSAITELNIADLTNRSRGEYAYTLLDLDSNVTPEAINHLEAIPGIIKVRVIKN